MTEPPPPESGDGPFPPFTASVTRAGFGSVCLLTDRTTLQYPAQGDRVEVLPAPIEPQGTANRLPRSRAVLGEDSARYAVGFMLDHAHEHVVLIRKNRPAWQAGKLNGVGGKIEPGETAAQAMSREFMEETGRLVAADWWQQLCVIRWPNDLVRVGSGKAASVTFFRYVWSYEGSLECLVKSRTDEAIEVHRIDTLPDEELVPNLRWLIPLAAYTADNYEPFAIEATCAETHPVVRGGLE